MSDRIHWQTTGHPEHDDPVLAILTDGISEWPIVVTWDPYEDRGWLVDDDCPIEHPLVCWAEIPDHPGDPLEDRAENLDPRQD